MAQVFWRIWHLARLAVTGPRAWIGAAIYLVVLGLQFFGVWVSVRQITWQRDFFDALEQMDAAGALHQMGIFAILVGASASAHLAGSWLRKRLLIHWREVLTNAMLDMWLNGQAYWHLRPGLSPDPVENPDQRIAEDCRKFIDYLLDFTLDLLSRVVAIISYVAILWGLSQFPLAFSLLGWDVSIPRYMVLAAFLYVFISSVVTHLLGKPLKNLSFAQERFEADFRYSLVQVRESANEIAQARGEDAEHRRLQHRFDALRANWARLIGREFILGLFTRPYRQTVLRIPIFLALPAYFGNALSLGGLMQTASAFSNVTTTLSWFIFSYARLAAFVAVSERLDGLVALTRRPPPMPDAPRNVTLVHGTDDTLRCDGLVLYTPGGRALQPFPDIHITRGEHVWISGPSGQGKTTFLSALLGLWPYGQGTIILPDAPVMALPQTPALFNEGILQALTYPIDPDTQDGDRLAHVLQLVGLGHRIPLRGQDGPACLQGLSIGERQRLALARAIFLRPDWLALDEATSALDHDAEQCLLAVLERELPDCTILCIAHRPPHGLKIARRIILAPAPTPARKTA
ncbi:ABC transporter ATP-binding protein/permease [Roseinatronobacter sp. S2]|uniref:ABC transporter ATP-binding protein/permease n=1 Tax=Roseinatronobacter sp. S2 TaxID=3035471 RepID=UPI00240EF362|nr:ABC transporter ATP-binding protein/permease [Roseinatronobacter sp. S2]WFE74008.1 ABC transporter ATP-binding protein/permease [Roseinatronobacter sp. S2]